MRMATSRPGPCVQTALMTMTLSRLPLRAKPLLFAETPVKFPGIVEDVDAVVDGFGNHIVHLSLIRNGAEMEAAAYPVDGTFEAGTTQRIRLAPGSHRRWIRRRFSTAAGTFSAGITAENLAIAAPFREASGGVCLQVRFWGRCHS